MLWDTSVFVDYLRGLPSADSYLNTVRNGTEQGCYSVITEAELWAGKRDQQEEMVAAAALSWFKVIDIDTNIARLAGDLLNQKSSG